MSQAVSRADVTEEVRQRCDLSAYTTETPITQAQIDLMADDSARRLGSLLNEHYGEGYNAQIATLTTQAGVDIVSLPSTFSTLLRLDWVVGSNAPLVPLQIASVDNWQSYPNTWGWSCSAAPLYRLSGNVIAFYPTPDQVYTLRLQYQGGMTFDGGTLYLRSGWRDWLVCDIAVRVRQRQQKDYGDFASERERCEAAIIRQARRDNYAPRQIRDVRTPAAVARRRGPGWWL